MRKGNPSRTGKHNRIKCFPLFLVPFLVTNLLHAQFPASLLEALAQDSSFKNLSILEPETNCDALVRWMDANLEIYERIMPVDPGVPLDPLQIEARRLLDTVISYARTVPCEEQTFSRIYFLLQKVGYDYFLFLPAKYLRSSQFLEAGLDSVRPFLPDGQNQDPLNQDLYSAWRTFLFNPLARIYNRIGAHQSALALLDTSLFSQFPLGDSTELEAQAAIWNEIGHSFLGLRDPNKALAFFSPAIAWTRQVNSKEAIRYKLNRANALRLTGEQVNAQSELLTLISHLEQLSNLNTDQQEILSDAYLFLGYAHRDLGLSNASLNAFERSLQGGIQRYDTLLHKALAEVYNALGYHFLRAKKYPEASAYFTQEIQCFDPRFSLEDLNYTPPIPEPFFADAAEGMGTVWLNLYQKDSTKKFLSQALTAFQLSLSVYDSLQSLMVFESSRTHLQQDVRELLHKMFETLYALWTHTQDPHYMDLAWTYLERSRANELRAQVWEANRADTTKRLRDILREISLLELDLKTHPKDVQLLTKLQSAKRKLRDAYPVLNTQKFETPFLSAETLQQKLGQKEALLAYFWREEDLYRLVLKKKEAYFDRIPIDSLFGVHLSQFTRIVQDMHAGASSIPQFVESGHYLFEKLFYNLEKEIPTQWVILPDTLLLGLPFEALLRNRQNLELKDYKELSYLWKNWDIQYAFSPYLWVDTPPTSNEPPYYYVGWAPAYDGDPAGSTTRTDFQRLRFNQHEVEESSQHFPSPKKVLTGFPVSKDAFFQHVEKAAFLHTSMHFDLGTEADLGTLVFTDRDAGGLPVYEPLYQYEIYRLNLLAKMCVLSACNTGSGPFHIGEGPRNLAWAFRNAGCPNILMSLWPAHDESSGSLIPLYIQNLKEGYDKRRALRRARNTYFQSSPHRKSAPFYWANFVLIGDRSDYHIPTSSGMWEYIAYLLGIMGILGLSWMGVRRKFRMRG